MKTLFYALSFLFLTSCFKKEYEENPETAADSTAVTVVDSAATLIPDSAVIVIDSTATIIPENSADANLSDYEIAEKYNTSKSWKNFLDKNPDYKDAEKIRKEIIRLEVAEIMNDKNTGKMPESEKVSNRSSSITSMQVSNDTSCELTLRYSGTDAIMVTIPANSTKKINISSGNYNVAASACGYNYAGNENLNGDYSVSYYISNTYR